MKKSLLFLFCFSIALFNISPVAGGEPVITATLSQELSDMEANDLIRINIALRDQYDAESLQASTRNLSAETKRNIAINELKAFSARTQSSLLNMLHSYESLGSVKNIKPFWIANVINCYATPELIEVLALRNDVWFIDYDQEYQMIDPGSYEDSEEIMNPEGITEITWNVSKVNAPQVWDLGFKGEGIVVSVLDTGVNYNHNDIKNNMWEHPDYPYHGWNYIANNNNPMDDHGHGTHCAGTVAGDGTSGSQTGVAPKAKIMAMKILNSQGGGTPGGVWSGIEFSVDNGAHVLSLSLGWTNASNSDRQVWRNTFNNALAAGVISAVAAGNEGNMQWLYPIPNNVRTPGNVPPPWLHPDQTLTGGTSGVMSIGATNSNDGLAGFSGRGPVTWQSVPTYNDYAYNPGMGLIRPDVVAPGDNVKSLIHTNNSGYTTMSGTSMATPCVAGVMALMLSKNENISPELMCEILETTTVVLTPGKNNNTGSGRVDALAAVNAVVSAGPEYFSHTINDAQGNNNGMINPGEFIHLSISIKNASTDAVNNVTVQLSSPSPYIQLIDSVEFYGNFAPGQIIEIEDGFAFQVAENIPNNQRIHFGVVCNDGVFQWDSEFYIDASSPRLLLKNLLVNDHDGNLNGLLDPGESAAIFINTVNSGAFEAQDVTGSLTTSYPHILIETHEFFHDHIAASDSIEGYFTLSLLPGAEAGDAIYLTYTVDYGAFTTERNYTLHVSATIEDFETTDFSRFNWSSRGHATWNVVRFGSVTPIDGEYAARSGIISGSQRSELSLTYYVSQDDTISFYYYVSSESGGDFLKFSINNVLQDQWSGESGWQFVSFPVTSGNKIFKWEYEKNASGSSGMDMAMIDHVVLPPGQTTTVFAGENSMICNNQHYDAQGTASYYTQSIWTSSGDGYFSSPSSLSTQYFPGTLDLESESVILTLEVTGISNIISHSATLGFVPAAEVYAGEDIEICEGNPVMIEDATALNYTLLTWSGNGSGTFDDPHALQTFYTPSTQDIENGSVVITLTAKGMATCEDVESSFTLTIHALPTAMLSGDVDICHGEQAQLSILLTGTPPWEVLTSMDDQPLLINTSPYQFSVSPDVSTVYSLISVSDANMCSNNAVGQASVNVSFIPANPEMPAGPADVDYAYVTSSVYTISEVENANTYMWGIEPVHAGSLAANGTEATVSWADNFQGEVDIFVLAQNECGNSALSDIKKVNLKNTTGIAGKDGRITLNLYPNPSTGMFTLMVGSPQAIDIDLNIVNLLGQVVYTQSNISVKGQSTLSIDPGNLDVGIYMVTIISPHVIANKKLIISR